MRNESNEKPYFLKRVVAYLIDLILVMLLSTSITMVFINTDNYRNRTEELMNLTKSYSEGKITKEEYSAQFDEMNYFVTKEGVGTSIVTCSVSLVYYVILCYFCHGITLGKYIMKIRIVGNNDKKLTIGHFLIRALLVNLILSNLISIIFVSTMNQSTFVSIYPKVSNVLTIFLLATLLCMTYRNDGRGLHDILASTKVISTKEKKIKEEVKEEIKEEVKDEVVEAKVIEEKKLSNKKSTNKKSTKKTGGKK